MRAAEASFAFPTGGGMLGQMIRDHDWAGTAIGPLTGWPQSLKTVTQMLLLSPVPIVLLWGEDGVMIYNDAYSVFAGSRHPALLGSKVREGWDEVADFNDNVMRTGLAGQTLAYRNQELTLERHGRPEPVWMDLDYSPVLDESGAPAGVIAIVVETTEKVLTERRLVESEQRFRALANASSDAIYRMSPDWKEMRYLDGRALLADTDRPSIAWMDEYLLPEDRPGIQAAIDQAIANRTPFQLEHRVRQADGSIGWTASRAVPIMDEDGAIVEWFGAATDVTRRETARKYRDALAELTDSIAAPTDPDEIGYRAAQVVGQTLEVSRVGYGTIDPVAETLHVARDWAAPGTASLAGVMPLRDYGSFIDSLKHGEFISIADVAQDARTAAAAEALHRRDTHSFMNLPVIEHGELVAVFYVNHAATRTWTAEERAFVKEAGARTRNAVERSRIDANLRELNLNLQSRIDQALQEQAAIEEALRQAQKMEAVGQLTGGLAHDFNNLLTGIMGNLELLHLRIARGRLGDLDRFIHAAQGAGRRAASLTQRLLAFSRRQTLDPKPTDVNRLIAGLQEMLQRTVGANAHIEVVGAAGLWPANIDASQLENAILNLCINGRDAMPNGGKLTIETANKWMDERAARERDLLPGQYLSICVTDTGTGMSQATIARAFEPFFTTKPIGQGTGLGLSMIYGFAKQSGGQVRIYSELGQGTTVCIYLPRHHGESGEVICENTSALTASASTNTVLVVDDEPTIRHLIDEVLDDLGYKVIGVADGAAGIKVLQSGVTIDLLITDVGLPNGMNGRQVADAARELWPGLKVLFITGFAENAAVGNGHLEPGMELLTKPFTLEALSVKVAEILKE